MKVRDRISAKGQGRRLAAGLLLLAGPHMSASTAVIALPNASFEAPATPFVSTLIESWQKTAKPAWYEEGGGYSWDSLTGIFQNPAPGTANYIDNCDSDQALWLFAVPEVGLFLDLDGIAGRPEVAYEPGRSYLLTLGVIGGGGNMLEGVTLEVACYYPDDAGDPVTVAAVQVTHSLDFFPRTTHFVDVELRVPTVSAADAWAHRPLGLRFLSTVGFDLQGGYWDLDHVRLTSYGQPALTDAALADGAFTFTLESEPGLSFEMLASSEPGLPLAEWTSMGTVTNTTGRTLYSEPIADASRRFYRARQIP